MAVNGSGVYYFLGNITSHVVHALPLYKKLGGTFIVLSEGAKKEIEAHKVPVVCIDDIPSKWIWNNRRRPQRIRDFLVIDKKSKNTIDYLNKHAKVVVFYELFKFSKGFELVKPKKLFLTHGNMLKDYMKNNDRLNTIKQYDYMAAIGPSLKKQLTKDGVPPVKLVDLGIARTDDIVRYRNKVASLPVPISLPKDKPVFLYTPTFWGNSSVDNVGLDLVRLFPEKYTLLFKPHPQTLSGIVTEYKKLIKNKPNVFMVGYEDSPSIDLATLFAISSVIIGDVSSVMLEAILTNKPLLFIGGDIFQNTTDSVFSAVNPVIEKNSLEEITDSKNLEKLLDKKLLPSMKPNYDEISKKLFYLPKEGAAESIGQFIKSLV